MNPMFQVGTQARSPSGNIYQYAQASMPLGKGVAVVFNTINGRLKKWTSPDSDGWIQGFTAEPLGKDDYGWVLMMGDLEVEHSRGSTPPNHIQLAKAVPK